MPDCMSLPWMKIHEFLLEVGAERDPANLCLQTLNKIDSLIPFDSAILYLVDETGVIYKNALVEVDSKWNHAYLDYYSKLDNSSFSFYRVGAGVYHWDDFNHTEYVTDFVRPQHFNYSIGIKFFDTASKLAGALALNRSESSFGFYEAEIAILNIITPHLTNLHANLYVSNNKKQLEERIGNFQDLPLRISALSPVYQSLTRREEEVAALLCKGLNTQTIGILLMISPRTVHKHIENIFEKLKVTNRQELVVKILKML